MINRVAFLSMHTSPLRPPGVGDAGGMNVYVDELARTLTGRGVKVDVFTRRDEPGLSAVVEPSPGYRVHHLAAGPPHQGYPVRQLARSVRSFAEQVIQRIHPETDIVHTHYWLSGWAGLVVKRRLGIPLANSFHTLGRVKNLNRRADEPPESLLRIAAEHEVIEASDCVVASTPAEAEDLLEHYGADPARLCTSPPGVDHTVFSPGSKEAARSRLGLGQGPLVLFVGRIQPLKGVDVAVEAFARLHRRQPGARMMIVGGPSGPSGADEAAAVLRRIQTHGLDHAVSIHPPVPHSELPTFYRAADVLLLPSRSESFGLVAAEAQSCGLPVVASRVGGLVYVLYEGESGLLVEGWNPDDYAEALERVITDKELAERLATGAVEWAERFSWEATANRFLELYEGAAARSRENAMVD